MSEKVIKLGSFGSVDISYVGGVFSLVETTSVDGVLTAGATVKLPTTALISLLGAIVTKAAPSLSGFVLFLEPLIEAGLAAL